MCFLMEFIVHASVPFFASVTPDAHCNPAAARLKLTVFTVVHRTNNQPEGVASVGFMSLSSLVEMNNCTG